MRRRRRTPIIKPLSGGCRFGRGAAGALAGVAAGGLLLTAAVTDGQEPAGSAQPSAASTPAVLAPDMVPAASDDSPAEAPEGGEQEEVFSLQTVEVSLSRDPFDPVRPQKEDEEAGGTGDGAGGNGTSPPPDGNGTSEGRCVEQGELVCDGQVVEVEATTTSGATISVGGVSYSVAVGERFADDFVLTDVDASGCAVLEYLGRALRACPGGSGTLK